VIDEEQDWIAKYRAALGANPIKQSRVGTLVAGLQGVIQKLVSAIGKASPSNTTAQLDVKPFEELPCPRIAQAGTSEHNPQSRSDGSNTQGPGKQHPSGEPEQLRAS
jgi:hypothetical protein